MKIVDEDGQEIEAPFSIVQGAIPWTSHLLLGMMQREWERPLHADHWVNQEADGPSQRAAVVLLFWTHFEFLMERFFDAAMADYPGRARDDLLKRYGQIGARLDRLYKIIFDTTFWSDLEEQHDVKISAHLREVQECRNRFMHGEPQALSEQVTTQTVELLHETQDAWIRLYNRRCAGRQRRTHVWDENSSN